MAIAKTHFLITAAMLATPLVTAGCASSDENSTEVNPGVVTTGDRDNYRYLRSRDMDRMQRESARQRDAKRAAAKAEQEAAEATEAAAAEDETAEKDDSQ